MADNNRFRVMMEYLKKNRYVRNQQDFTERVNSDKATVSQIMNDKISIPNKMFDDIASAFPFISVEWLKNGAGEMIKSTYTQNINGGKNISQTGNINSIPVETLTKAIDEIAEQRKLVSKSQEQIDRLLAIIERMQGDT